MSTGDLELRRVRAAQNQVLFRQLNRQIDRLNEQAASSGDVAQYVCECLDRNCDERIEMPHAEYERIRRGANAFFVVPGHEMPDVEEVVDREERWVVVRKLGAGAKVVAELSEADL